MDFPEAMKQERRWCAWFYEFDKKRQRYIKKPYNLNTWQLSKPALSDTPETWGTYKQALNAYEYFQANPDYVNNRTPGSTDKVSTKAGLGFMLGSGNWAAVDLDDIDTLIANHSLGEKNLVDDIQNLLGPTYCELSRSQGGLHFIFKLENNVEQFNKKKLVNGKSREIYGGNGRFIALTNNALADDLPLKISTISQAMWQQLHQLLFGEYAPPGQTGNSDFSNTELSHGVLSDTGVAVIDSIMQSTDAKRFNWWLTADLPVESTNVTGKQFPDENGQLINYDPSAQDMACCNMLAYWVRQVTGDYDSRLIDEVFKRTNLYRPKWDRMDGGGTYGQRTIKQAIDHKRQQLERYMRGY